MKGLGIGFGLERIALFVYERPRLGVPILLVVAVLAGYGMMHVRFNDDLRNIFAGNTQTYRDYVAATDEFVDPENELLVLVEGKDLGSPENFQKLQDFQLELQLLDGVDNVYSLFALREPPDANGDAAPLVNDASAGLTPELLKRIRAHPVLGDRLISADGTAMVFTVTPSEPKAPLEVARKLTNEITTTAKDALDGTDMKVTVTGFPVIRYSIADIVRHDQVALNIVGALIGTVMSLIVFRSFVASILAAAPAIIAAIAVVGFMGLFGVKVTVMSTIVPALVMIFGYADGMHLGFAWRKYRQAGYDVVEAERLAQTRTCRRLRALGHHHRDRLRVADHLLGDHGAQLRRIRRRRHARRHVSRAHHPRPADARARPLLEDAAGPEDRQPAGRAGSALRRHRAFRRALRPAAVGALRDPLRAARRGALFGQARALLPRGPALQQPGQCRARPARPRLRRRLPARDRRAAEGRRPDLARGARPRARRAGGGRQGRRRRPAAVAVEPRRMAGRRRPGQRRRGAQEDARPGDADDQEPLRRHHRQCAHHRHHPEMSSSHSAALVDKVEAAIAATGVDGVKVTGVTVINARESTRTISILNASLLLSVVANLGVIALAFGGLSFGLVSFLPNMLPILAVGTMLFFAGRGMQFTAVIALTVAFGVAVNDSVHFINRFLHTDNDGSLSARLIETSRRIGPVIIGATLIIIAGVSTTLTSGMPTIGLFGKIAALTLVAGIFGDLIVLPALMGGPARRWFDRHRTIKPHEAKA